MPLGSREEAIRLHKGAYDDAENKLLILLRKKDFVNAKKAAFTMWIEASRLVHVTDLEEKEWIDRVAKAWETIETLEKIIDFFKRYGIK